MRFSPDDSAPIDPSVRHYRVTGMDCAGCARSVEKGVNGLSGVRECQLSFPGGTLVVEGDIQSRLVLERIEALGFGGDVECEDGTFPEEVSGSTDPDAPNAPPPSLGSWFLEHRSTWPALMGALLLLPGLIFHEILQWHAQWIEAPAFLALLLAGFPVVRSAWRGLRINRELNIQALMTIAAGGAVVIGAWVEAGMVMVLFSLGESLEGYAADRARRAIRGLMNLAPDQATLLDPDGTTRRVGVREVDPGCRILVKPGERVPLDGEVLEGQSSIDESALTGESLPRDTRPGDEILAGSINGEGSLELRVLREAEETALHRMIRLIEEAQGRRAPTQRFIDRFARVYTPAVIVMAVMVAALPPLLFGAPFLNPDPGTFGWFYRALALLVVACPCALVISVPVSVVSALTNAARSGVLIKGGAHLEMLSRVRAVAFDKTGTLTEGALTVVGVQSVDCTRTGAMVAASSGLEEASTHQPMSRACTPCDDLLAVAAAVEERSEHPVGRAVVGAARDRLTPDRIPYATGHRALTGRGITARLGHRTVTIASPRHFGLEEQPDPAVPGEPAHTSVLVEMDGRQLGKITLSEVPRDSARSAVKELEEMGITTILLSGDSVAAARQVADRVGIRRVEGRLLPEEKLDRVESLRQELGSLAMVGDGINDAPALAAANVGIAVGGDLGGTDQAREVAAVTLMRDDLTALPRTLKLARRTMRTVRQNVVFAVGIKVVFMVLVLAGMGTLWMAVLADVGATLLVTLWGLRLLRDDSFETSAPPSPTHVRATV